MDAARLRRAVGRLLLFAWCAAALVVAGSGVTAGLLDAGGWLIEDAVLSLLLAAMVAKGVAGWRDAPMRVVVLGRAFAGWGLGFIALTGLTRLLGPAASPLLGVLALTGLPLVASVMYQRLRAGGPSTVLVVAPATAGGGRCRPGLGRDRDLFGPRDRPEPPGFAGWRHADHRWLELIGATSAAPAVHHPSRTPR